MIITISREFGSGGRELGKRLANASLSAKGLEKEKTMLTDFCAQPEKLQEF